MTELRKKIKELEVDKKVLKEILKEMVNEEVGYSYLRKKEAEEDRTTTLELKKPQL